MDTSLEKHRSFLTLSWNFQPFPYCVHGAVEKLWIPRSVSFMPVLLLRVCVLASLINIHWVGPSCCQLLECVLWFVIVSCGCCSSKGVLTVPECLHGEAQRARGSCSPARSWCQLQAANRAGAHGQPVHWQTGDLCRSGVIEKEEGTFPCYS